MHRHLQVIVEEFRPAVSIQKSLRNAGGISVILEVTPAETSQFSTAAPTGARRLS